MNTVKNTITWKTIIVKFAFLSQRNPGGKKRLSWTPEKSLNGLLETDTSPINTKRRTRKLEYNKPDLKMCTVKVLKNSLPDIQSSHVHEEM